ncbi:MAG: transposase zinc-binding domain-containing protein, partial [Deltaproteobacteria bacterium]|nr:transposase zinc-binding domain-containing protein [Deltaproteobacteria bacterium]
MHSWSLVLAVQKIIPPPYVRHEPQKTILYRAVEENFLTFAQAIEETGQGRLPTHVYREVEAYMDCGILACGFIRVRCRNCHYEKLVALSCKRRGFCPSCGGRRMNEVAAHLTDFVFPKVPVRQWVLSLPFLVRYLLAYNPKLTTKILAIFIRVVTNWYQKTARKDGVTCGKVGVITFIQRFGGAINLNVHFHSLFLDGAYYEDEGKWKFHSVRAPRDLEIATLARRINCRVTRYLKRQGLLDSDDIEACERQDGVLSEIGAASIQNLIAVGERKGKKVRRIGRGEAIGDYFVKGKRCA